MNSKRDNSRIKTIDINYLKEDIDLNPNMIENNLRIRNTKNSLILHKNLNESKHKMSQVHSPKNYKNFKTFEDFDRQKSFAGSKRLIPYPSNIVNVNQITDIDFNQDLNHVNPVKESRIMRKNNLKLIESNCFIIYNKISYDEQNPLLKAQKNNSN